MGVVTETLTQLIVQHVTEHGIVMWFDPERHYDTVVASIAQPGWHFLTFKDSYYHLRAEVEPWVRGFDPPKLLVYLPIEYSAAKGP
jgi:hypothetical protein